MHRSSVAFAIQAPEEIARDRLRAVLRFYGPCGELKVRVRRDQALNLTAGEIVIGAGSPETVTRTGVIFSTGERLPAHLTDPDALLDASDAQLRSLDGSQAAVTAGEGRARIVAGAGGGRTWFAAGDAYATSIGAATLLGAAAPFVDPDSLPELMVMGTCLGERTHVKGVRALAPSTVVDFGAGEHEAWPALARWAPVDDPGEHAWGALLDTLSRRLDHEPAPWVALDGSGDAALLLAAADELGIGLPAFSAGDEAGRPVRISTALEARELALRNALLSDGARSLAPFEIAGAPARATSVLTGFGGGIMRGTSYPDDLVARTPADHRPAIEIRLREWLEQATANGSESWSAFDMLLIEEGVSEKAHRVHFPVATVEPLRAPEFARALSSLSPETRAGGTWHEDKIDGLELPEPPAPAAEEDDFGPIPQIREWVMEELLAHPLLRTALGELWVERLVERPDSEEALAAASAVIFDQRLQAAAQPPAGWSAEGVSRP